jgi:2-polyprenyl-3-methyl-5-hydroxy-6-metoxy-1,4-benzoquinol methylase
MSDSKRKVYDDIYCRKSISYEAPHGTIAFLHRKLLRFEVSRYQRVYSLLPNQKERLLDVGCGDGYFVFMANERFKECYGVDVSPGRIQQAKDKHKSGKKSYFQECDVDEGLPFNDSFFDVLTCMSVLEHVFSPSNLVEEINRVLKPGGIFIVQVPNIAWLPYRFQLLFGKLPVTGGVYLGADWEHLHNFTKSSLCTLLIGKGFAVEKITCSGIFSDYFRLWPSTLGGDLIVRGRKQAPTRKI